VEANMEAIENAIVNSIVIAMTTIGQVIVAKKMTTIEQVAADTARPIVLVVAVQDEQQFIEATIVTMITSMVAVDERMPFLRDPLPRFKEKTVTTWTHMIALMYYNNFN